MAAALAGAPLAWRVIDHGFLHAYQKLWVALDRRDLAFLGFDKHLTLASPFQSWYGPLGFLLVLAGFGLAWLGVRHRGLPRVVVLLALAPVVWLVLQAARPSTACGTDATSSSRSRSEPRSGGSC